MQLHIVSLKNQPLSSSALVSGGAGPPIAMARTKSKEVIGRFGLALTLDFC